MDERIFDKANHSYKPDSFKENHNTSEKVEKHRNDKKIKDLVFFQSPDKNFSLLFEDHKNR